MKKELWLTIGAGLGIGLGCVGLASAAISAHGANACKRMISDSTRRIGEMSHVDIDRSIVDQAVQKAVHEQAADAVRLAADKVQHDMSADIRNRVKQVVDNRKQDMVKQVSDKLATEMSKIDRDSIMDPVIEAVTEKLVDKLGDELDEEIGKIGAIYKGIAAAMR